MTTLAAAITLAIMGLALQNWRNGILALLVVGVLQDVFRKLTPGLPAYYLLWPGALFGFIFVLAYGKGAVRHLQPIYLADNRLKSAWRLFFIIVLAQAAHALVRWGNPAIPVLGVFFYLGPIAGLLLGVAYARTVDRIEILMQRYVAIMLPTAMTVLLSVQFSEQYPILQEIGAFVGAKMIMHSEGQVLESFSGLFRVGEIAAWHAACSAMFLVILMVRNPTHFKTLLTGIVVVALVVAIVYTGRRKMLVTLSIFGMLYWALTIYLHRGLKKRTIGLLLLGLMLATAINLLDFANPSAEQAAYFSRGTSVFEETFERADTAFMLLSSAIWRSDFIGMGAGVVAQGSQYVDIGNFALLGASEAGIGRIVVELGVPGAVIAVWLLYRLLKASSKALRELQKKDPKLASMAAAFAAILIANAMTFAVATQVYGDHFVLIMLGLVAGMLFCLMNYGIQSRNAIV